MTVGELIEELKKFNKNLKVEVQHRDDSDYGTDTELLLTNIGDTIEINFLL